MLSRMNTCLHQLRVVLQTKLRDFGLCVFGLDVVASFIICFDHRYSHD